MTKRMARRFSNQVAAMNAMEEGMERARALGYTSDRDLARFGILNLRRFGLTLKRNGRLTQISPRDRMRKAKEHERRTT